MSKWITKKLSPDICKLVKGQQINRIELASYGDYYVLNGGIEPSGYHEKYNTEANTISISEGGNSCGFVAFNKVAFWSGGHNYTLKNLSSEIRLDYLYNYLKYRENYIMGLRVGSGLPNIQRKELSNVSVYYPKQEAEQRKIAEVFSTVDDAIEKTTAIIEKYTAIKHGLMQRLLKKENNEGKWEIKPLKNYARVFDGTHQTPDYVESGIKFISVEDINNIYASDKYITNEAFSKFKIKPQNNDILMTRIGDIGTPAMVEDKEHIAFYVSLSLIRCKKNILPKFLYYAIKSKFFQNELLNNAILASFPRKINLGDIGKCNLCIPTSLDVQQETIDKLSAIDNKIETERNYLNKLLDIKKGLMHDLLTNKVSVEKLLKEEAI